MKQKRNWVRKLCLLLFSLLFIAVMLRWFEHNQVYHPDRMMTSTGAELGRPFQDVFFQTTDGVELNGWFFPAATNSPRALMAVLLCHGNAGNISHRLEMCQVLLATGVNVFVFDYRGYGRSHGRPSEEGTYRDALAAVQWLQTKGFSPRNILGFGESLGGGVGSELALRGTLGGLVLQSTFTSVPDVGAELFPWLPVRWLARIKYDTFAKLPLIKIPVMVMHSRADRLIHFGHGQKNFAVANEPKLFCELSGGHSDPLMDQDGFLLGIEKFLRMMEMANVEPARARK